MSALILDNRVSTIPGLSFSSCEHLVRQRQDMQSLTLVGRSEDVLHDSSLHRTDIILEDIMEEQFHFYREGTEEEVRDKIERVFHPLFLVLTQLIVSNAIRILNVVQHTVDANLDLLE